MSVDGFTKRGWLALFVLAAAVLAGCGHPAPAKSEPKTEAKTVDPVPQRRDADDTARFLAGMPGKEGSPFLELENTPAWKEHRRELDEAWKGTEGTLIAGLGEFQKQEL